MKNEIAVDKTAGTTPVLVCLLRPADEANALEACDNRWRSGGVGAGAKDRLYLTQPAPGGTPLLRFSTPFDGMAYTAAVTAVHAAPPAPRPPRSVGTDISVGWRDAPNGRGVEIFGDLGTGDPRCEGRRRLTVRGRGFERRGRSRADGRYTFRVRRGARGQFRVLVAASQLGTTRCLAGRTTIARL